MEEINNKLRMEKGQTAGTERVMGERKLVEEIKSTPRPPETDGVSGCACGTINDNLARVQAQSHFEQSLKNFKIGQGKRAGRWRAVVWPHLHIDDGSMGGGGPITHSDNDIIVYQPQQAGDLNDFQDYKDAYFSGRQGIFHYCLMAHELEWNGQTWGGLANGAYPGHFSIADATVINTNQQARHFMHELGHTIGLPDVGHMGDDYWSSMNEDKRFYTGYEDNEWDIILNQGGISRFL
jgi:hypothetical protein